MRFWQSSVARSAQVKGARALQDSTFNTRTCLVALFEFLSGLALAGGLQGLVLGLWLEMKHTCLDFRFGALGSTLTAGTILTIKLDLYDLTDCFICASMPTATHFALGTSNALSFPIHNKKGDVKALPGSGLPTKVRRRRAIQINRVLGMAAYQIICIDIDTVYKVLAGQKALFVQGGVNDRCHIYITCRRWRCLDIDYYIWRADVTGL